MFLHKSMQYIRTGFSKCHVLTVNALVCNTNGINPQTMFLVKNDAKYGTPFIDILTIL